MLCSQSSTATKDRNKWKGKTLAHTRELTPEPKSEPAVMNWSLVVTHQFLTQRHRQSCHRRCPPLYRKHHSCIRQLSCQLYPLTRKKSSPYHYTHDNTALSSPSSSTRTPQKFQMMSLRFQQARRRTRLRLSTILSTLQTTMHYGPSLHMMARYRYR
jgi:hypothetical protein